MHWLDKVTQEAHKSSQAKQTYLVKIVVKKYLASHDTTHLLTYSN